MATEISKELTALARDVANGGASRSMTVRELLRHFGQERRGQQVMRFIRYKLGYLGVDTEPRFDETHIDSVVRLVKKEKRPRGKSAKPQATETDKPPEPAREPVAEESEETRNPSLTIGLLASANRPPHSVRAVSLSRTNRKSFALPAVPRPHHPGRDQIPR
jgi:hypothetical protein